MYVQIRLVRLINLLLAGLVLFGALSGASAAIKKTRPSRTSTTLKAPVRVFKVPGYVEFFALSADRRTLACVSRTAISAPAVLSVWDARTGVLLKRSSESMFAPVALSPDNTMLVGLGAAAVYVQDLETGKIKATSMKSGLRMSFSPDGRALAIQRSPTRAPAQDVFVYDTNTWKQTAVLHSRDQGWYDLAFSPDGTLLASAMLGEDGECIHTFVWSSRTGKQVYSGAQSLPSYDFLEGYNPLVFVSNRMLVNGSYIIDVANSKSIPRRIFAPSKKQRWPIGLYHPGGDLVVYRVLQSNELELWSIRSVTLRRCWRFPTLAKKNRYVNAEMYLAGKLIAIQENKNTISVWRLK
ncbi:MAG: hypothetical protein M1305_02240 [Candidatus Marsarchaeota archaeon]|nr:hypothetical protein [Candidatus Marsarchaeota archaeon]